MPVTGSRAWLPAVLAMIAAAAFILGSDYMIRRSLAVDDSQAAIEGIPLTALIRKVKQDLRAAEQIRIDGGELSLFELQDFDLEVNIVASGKTEADFTVLAVGSTTSIARERVQKIHLKFVASKETRPVVFEPVGTMGKADMCDGPPELCGGK